MHPQPRQQLGQAAGGEHQLDIRSVEHRPDEVLLEVARHRGHGADAQHLALLAPAFAQHSHQLAAGGEDGLGVVERQPAALRQRQGAASAMEQLLAQLGFQLLDLCRQC